MFFSVREGLGAKDRAKGMYMQIATARAPHSQKDFYAPTIASMVLRKLTKPFVDHFLFETEAFSDRFACHLT